MLNSLNHLSEEKEGENTVMKSNILMVGLGGTRCLKRV